MQPCYLPDGGIAFISTRCQYGILCDAPDDFTTTVLYRMDADGRNLRKLSNSSVSEASPVVLPDGRILYTRWEYVDKGAVSVKCLWAMRPDGIGVVGNLRQRHRPAADAALRPADPRRRRTNTSCWARRTARRTAWARSSGWT